ncbi:orotidine-5'-phosphate decarboxylase [Thermohalobacter berrensis]|uniref:Orotidine 5'-phosphate decarboxylase n=1 Tax=Thermohalobacter berrensis TaxID=99594 RepID=A0A419TA40_9FIRM|nr:orotidine-5'-phosphate decarboxylase [Thermohalobacter berrensis]RKD34349.1 orotidine 5'-phosphate decarboxylase [Thermohalobacter berrensis]
MFIDRLIEKIKEKDNPTVVGLDPRIEFIPVFLRKKYGDIEAVYHYNKIIIDTIKDIVPCIKPQIAFYEALGVKGLEIFKRTVEYGRKNGLIVIADIKRGDIGSTAKAYAKAYLEGGFVEVDAVTINPYLGEDSIVPFTDYCNKDKGVFILAKTSNKSSKDLQDLTTKGKRIYETVGHYIEKWGNEYIGNYGYSSVCSVVGATYPKEMKILRKIMKSAYFLVPGYGAQGGTAKDIIHSFNDDGLGAIINSSRGIIAAHTKEEYKKIYKEEDFHLAIRDAAIKMKNDINNELKRKFN